MYMYTAVYTWFEHECMPAAQTTRNCTQNMVHWLNKMNQHCQSAPSGVCQLAVMIGPILTKTELIIIISKILVEPVSASGNYSWLDVWKTYYFSKPKWKAQLGLCHLRLAGPRHLGNLCSEIYQLWTTLVMANSESWELSETLTVSTSPYQQSREASGGRSACLAVSF